MHFHAECSRPGNRKSNAARWCAPYQISKPENQNKPIRRKRSIVLTKLERPLHPHAEEVEIRNHWIHAVLAMPTRTKHETASFMNATDWMAIEPPEDLLWPEYQKVMARWYGCATGQIPCNRKDLEFVIGIMTDWETLSGRWLDYAFLLTQTQSHLEIYSAIESFLLRLDQSHFPATFVLKLFSPELTLKPFKEADLMLKTWQLLLTQPTLRKAFKTQTYPDITIEKARELLLEFMVEHKPFIEELAHKEKSYLELAKTFLTSNEYPFNVDQAFEALCT